MSVRPDILAARASGSRSPRRALARAALFVLLLAGAAAAARWTPLGDYLTREALLGLLGELRQAWWAPLLLVGLYTLLCPLGLPATPLMFAGAVVFGPLWGTLYNFLGLLAGAVASYLVARSLGAELLHHLAGGQLRRIERLLSRHGGSYLFAIRFLPLPFPLVNFAMALAGIRFLPFAVTTALGLAPTITVWTYFYAALYQAAAGERAGVVSRAVVAMALLLAVSSVPAILARRARRRRYQRLRAHRAARSVTSPEPGA